MNYALSELEARHHRKELAIMERMEQLELARRQLGLSWADLGESDNYLRCAEAGTIQPSITVSSLSPEQMQGMLNTNVLLWRLGAGDTNATYIATTDFPLVNIIDPDTLAVTGRNMPPLADGISMQVRCRPISVARKRDYFDHFTLNFLHSKL